MHHDTLVDLMARWNPGDVLCVYHRNGFNTIVPHGGVTLDRRAIVGTDASGNLFALPLEEIVYAVLREDRRR